MIGAYAYGWSFGSEPVAGVTPIDNMIEELQRPLPDQISAGRSSPYEAERRKRQASHERRRSFSRALATT